MSFLWVLLILYVVYKLYKNVEYNKPENVIDRIDTLIDSRITSLKKAKATAVRRWESMKEFYEKQGEPEKYAKKIAEYELPISEQFKVHNLITHLREKYKYDTSKIIEILNDYLDWLFLEESYNYTHDLRMDVAQDSEDVDDVLNDYRESLLKSNTIKIRLIGLADRSVIKLLKIKADIKK